MKDSKAFEKALERELKEIERDDALGGGNLKTGHIPNLDPYVRRIFKIPPPRKEHRARLTIHRLSNYDYFHLVDGPGRFGLPLHIEATFISVSAITLVVSVLAILGYATLWAPFVFILLLAFYGFILRHTDEYIIVDDVIYVRDCRKIYGPEVRLK